MRNRICRYVQYSFFSWSGSAPDGGGVLLDGWLGRLAALLPEPTIASMTSCNDTVSSCSLGLEATLNSPECRDHC